MDRDFSVAKKHFDKGKQSQAKKVLCHCLQYHCAVQQILERGCIESYEACNQTTGKVLSYYTKSWNELESFVSSFID
jgi:hypothetical protein